MAKKIVEALIIVFLVAPYTLIGLISLLISLLSLDLYGIVGSIFMLSVPYPIFRSIMKKHIKSKEKQIIELPQLEQKQVINSSQLSTIFCTRCGAAMEESCKYCKDCGAPLNKT